MNPLRDSLLLCVAVVALALGAFTAGWWMGRAGAVDDAHEVRIAALEARLERGGTLAAAPPARPAPAARAEELAPAARIEVATDGAPARGPEDAPVTIVAFSDFQCPFCARVVPTLDRIQREYGDRVRVVFKHFPLPIHPQAMQAHQAALAAGDQGRFWEMHDRIFAQPQSLDRATLVAHAREIGLDVGAFETALDDSDLTQRIRSDVAEGRRVGVSATPSFLVNGRLFSGAQPYGSFKARVDEALEIRRAAVAAR